MFSYNISRPQETTYLWLIDACYKKLPSTAGVFAHLIKARAFSNNKNKLSCLISPLCCKNIPVMSNISCVTDIEHVFVSIGTVTNKKSELYVSLLNARLTKLTNAECVTNSFIVCFLTASRLTHSSAVL